MITIKNSFNKAALSYNDSCELQKQTGDQLISLVKKHYCQSSSILDLGCGTGIVTEQLAKNFNYETFISIDIANELLALASTILNPLSIEVIEADFNKPLKLSQFDIIFSNMALHWSDDFALTLQHIFKKLSKKGILAFSIPLLGTFDEIKNDVAIQTFMHDDEVKHYLTSIGYELIATEIQLFSFIFPKFLAALHSIKKVGATFVKQRSRAFSTLKQAIQTQQETVLTYRIGFFIAHSI